MPRYALRKVAIKPRAAPRRRAVVQVVREPAPAAPRKSKSDTGRAFRNTGTTLGASLGTAIGGPAGGVLGGILGKGAGSILSKIMGHGDYVTSPMVVNSNSVMLSNQAPSFVQGKNDVRIKHREYLGDVISSATAGAFQIQSFALNPGLEATFPWLSQVCGATFQQYRINGMVFEFRSMSSDALNSTNTALGSVVMATDYDSKDAVFTTKQQMENTMFGVSCKPSSSMLHAIECERSQTSVSELYIRPYDVPQGADIRLYDLARFSIATQGCQGTSVNLGELWVSYDISLFKQIEQPAGWLTNSAHYQLDVTSLSTAPIKLNLAQPYYDNIGLAVNSAGLVLTFPLSIQVGSVWSIFLQHTATAGGAAAVTPVTLGSTGGLSGGPKLINGGGSFGASWPSPSPGAANSRITGIQYYFTYLGGGTPASPPAITFTASATPFTAYQGGDLIVTQMFPNIL